MIRTEDLVIRRLQVDDIPTAQHLFTLMQEIFDSAPEQVSTTYLTRLLSNSAFIVFAAIYKGSVIGGLTAYELPMYNTELPEIYIYDIAVNQQFQRMGVGKSLLDAIKQHCISRGISQAFVQANKEDTGALNFYRMVGGNEENVSHFTYHIK